MTIQFSFLISAAEECLQQESLLAVNSTDALLQIFNNIIAQQKKDPIVEVLSEHLGPFKKTNSAVVAKATDKMFKVARAVPKKILTIKQEETLFKAISAAVPQIRDTQIETYLSDNMGDYIKANREIITKANRRMFAAATELDPRRVSSIKPGSGSISKTWQ